MPKRSEQNCLPRRGHDCPLVQWRVFRIYLMVSVGESQIALELWIVDDDAA